MKLDLHKKASLKEYIILWCLIFFAAYYFGVWQPTGNKLDTIELAQQQVDMDTEVVTAKLMAQKSMESALEITETEADTNSIPLYGNLNNACTELENILSKAASYRYELEDEVKSEHIVRRLINIDFQVSGSDTLKEILNEISDSENCYLINTLSIVKTSASDWAEDYSVTLQITYFEYDSNA